MTEKAWAIVGKVVVIATVMYAALWFLAVAISAALPIADDNAQATFIECRATFTLNVFWPPVHQVSGKPMEFCEQWAKEHP